MSVPKWRRSESRLDAFYEAVKLRHIVTQIIMRSYRLKTNFKSLIPDRLRKEYPDLAKLFEKFDSYKTLQDMDKLFNELFILDWKQVECKKKRRKSYNVKYGEKQSPACRRHGLELETEWD